jgi:hypothetical protein
VGFSPTTAVVEWAKTFQNPDRTAAVIGFTMGMIEKVSSIKHRDV